MTFDELLASGWVQLDAIAGRFDVPIEGRSREQRAVLALVLHARHVYHAILRDCAAGDIATALLSLRALSKAGVLIHWIELSPVDHVEMWEAEADRHRLAAEKAFDAMDRNADGIGSALRSPTRVRQRERSVSGRCGRPLGYVASVWTGPHACRPWSTWRDDSRGDAADLRDRLPDHQPVGPRERAGALRVRPGGPKRRHAHRPGVGVVGPRRKIAGPMVLYAAWTAGVVAIGRLVGAWDSGLAKDTAVWFTGRSPGRFGTDW